MKWYLREKRSRDLEKRNWKRYKIIVYQSVCNISLTTNFMCMMVMFMVFIYYAVNVNDLKWYLICPMYMYLLSFTCTLYVPKKSKNSK